MYVQSPPPRPEREPDRNQLVIRAAALGVLAAMLFGVLLFRLWALQVLHSDHYVAQANQNDVRTLALPAPRGEIVDRTGAVLVKNSRRALDALEELHVKQAGDARRPRLRGPALGSRAEASQAPRRRSGLGGRPGPPRVLGRRAAARRAGRSPAELGRERARRRPSVSGTG